MTETNLSLRRQLLWRLGPMMLLMLSLGGIGSYLLARHYSDHVYDTWLYDSARSLCIVIHRSSQGVIVDLPELSEKMFVWDDKDDEYFEIHGDHSGRLAGNKVIAAPPADAMPYHGSLLYNSIIDGEPARVVALKLPSDDVGEGIEVTVAETTHKRHALEQDILFSLLLFQTSLLAIASLVIWRGVGLSLKPLREIATRFEQHDLQRLLPLPESRVPGEIRPLTNALNNLLIRLDKSLVAQRRFIADAAHQLRTPLTGLLLLVEEAEQEADPDKRQQLLARLRLSSGRAIRLATQMLALSRAEPEAAASQDFQSVDLCALTRDAGAEWVPVALRKNVELSFRSDSDHVPIWGNAMLLQEAINNLIDNALKYHLGNGEITISILTTPHIQLIVDDDGPGIAESERPHVTKRFYQSERSRGGAGLGLAIVKEIANAHRAKLTIATGSSGQGTQIRLDFMAEAASPAESTANARGDRQ